MLEILKKKKEELLMEKSMNEAYQAYIYIMNRETNIHNIYAGKIITKPSTEEMMLNNLKKMCFLRGEKVEIIRESDCSYLILINGTTKDGINYTYTVTKKDISSEVLSKLKELVELDASSISVKYVSINFVPSYTFNINVPVVEITNDNVKTLHE